MDNILILSVLGMMALLALFFILLLVLFLRQKQVREQGKARRAAPEAPARGTRPRVARVAVVWPEEGAPLLWSVDGKPYAHPDEVTEPEQRAALATFFDILQRTVLPPAPVRAPAPLDTAPKPAIAPPAPQKAEAEELPAWLTVPPAPRAAPRPARPLSYEEAMEQPLVERLKSSFLTGRMRAISGTETLEKLEKPAIPQLDELDQLLRARLAGLPHAPSALIRQGSSGLLEIVVAGRIYERIEDVPQEEVRQAMREAVRAWEGGIL